MKTKFKISKKLILMAVSVLMIATTAISFALWSTGIDGVDEQDGNLSVTIGEGGTVLTELNLSGLLTTGEILIPDVDTIVAKGSEVKEIEVNFTVTWVASATQDETVNTEDIKLFTSTLSVELDAVLNATDAPVRKTLFNVDIEIDSEDNAIKGDGTAVPVKITITMNEPADYDEYLSVAGQNLKFVFKFSVDGIDYEEEFAELES